ncbi:MAG TPA: sulfurtransferase [Chloroflexota bacterium]
MNIEVQPSAIVSTSWVAEHIDDPTVRVVESSEDPSLYDLGHIPGAVRIDWAVDEQDQFKVDFIARATFEQLMSRQGITKDTTIVLYGDQNNWFAAYTFWLCALFGHRDCRVMDGGRLKWRREERPIEIAVPRYPASVYAAAEPDPSIRAFRDEVLRECLAIDGTTTLLDVRSPEEFRGEVSGRVGIGRSLGRRAGRIPRARNIPWNLTVNEDGTFKRVDELRALFLEAGITPEHPVITYCGIGERGSHAWFVLTQLLGYTTVKNYDGSWTEWGSLVGAPVERDEIVR